MSKNFELMQQVASEASRGARLPFDSVLDGLNKASGHVEIENSASDEALRLVQRVFLLPTQDAPRMVVIAGVNHGDGCSWISAIVSRILARNAHGPVCLVEANFRSPALPALFGTTNHHGFTDALQGKGPIRNFAKPVAGDKLWLISSGALAGDSAQLLTSELIKARLVELRSEFDYVIIDAPPLARYDDAIAIGQLTDGLILVLEAGSTRRETAHLAAANIRSSNIPLLAVVLNKRTFPIPESIYKRL
jgi:receptor protein-tyrosine kinase